MGIPLADFFFSIRSRLGSLGKPARLLVLFGIVAVVLISAIWLLNKIIIFYIAKSYVEELEDAFDLSPYLAKALEWITFAVAAILLSYAFSFSKTKSLSGKIMLDCRAFEA